MVLAEGNPTSYLATSCRVMRSLFYVVRGDCRVGVLSLWRGVSVEGAGVCSARTCGCGRGMQHPSLGPENIVPLLPC